MKNIIRDIMCDQASGFFMQVLKGIFYVFSLIYGVIVCLRGWLFQVGIKKSFQLPRPVISVGNITAGGVGKTPMVIFLAEYIKSLGLRPAILTRGYMQNASVDSDEAKMMLHRLKDVPIVVGADRYKQGVEFLEDDTCDVFILDDGYQHRRLKRDLDIILMDATNPWGNGHLIPRGILREPLSALERTDAIILTRTDQAAAQVKEIQQKVHQICPDKIYAESVHEPQSLIDLHSKDILDLKMIEGKSVYAISSIAYPQAFERTLNSIGAQIDGASHYLDHHDYSEENVAQLISDIQFQQVDFVVMTEKDEPKLEQKLQDFTSIPVLSLRISIQCSEGKERILGRVASLLDH